MSLGNAIEIYLIGVVVWAVGAGYLEDDFALPMGLLWPVVVPLGIAYAVGNLIGYVARRGR